MSLPPPTERQARLIWSALTGLAIATIVVLIVALVWGLGRVLALLAPIVWPLAVAGVLAYLLDPVVDALVRRRIPRGRAILLVFALALLIVTALAASVVPQLVRETRQLAERIPVYTERLQERVENWVNHPPALLQKVFDRKPAPTNAATSASTNTPPVVTVTTPPGETATATVTTTEPTLLARLWGDDSVKSATGAAAKAVGRAAAWLFGKFSVVGTFFGIVAGLALVPVYLFYLLLEKRAIERQWTDYLPVTKSDFKDELVFVLKSINDYLIVFFRGQVLVAICDGVLYTVLFSLIGLPYAVLLGVLAIPLTMIPFLGAIVTCLGALVIALVQYGDWLHPLLVLGVFAVVQTLEGLVIQPRIIGERVGLHPLTIIIAVITGTTLLGGLLGGLLAIPLCAALRVILGRYVWKTATHSEHDGGHHAA
jgi:predicted PurR-regulated permease PerM